MIYLVDKKVNGIKKAKLTCISLLSEARNEAEVEIPFEGPLLPVK